jgi:hypothetical protein
MRTLLVAAVLATLTGSEVARAQSPAVNGPSVADLHRAERMAQQARKRLETPSRKRDSSWLHGGR